MVLGMYESVFGLVCAIDRLCVPIEEGLAKESGVRIDIEPLATCLSPITQMMGNLMCCLRFALTFIPL